MANSCLDYDVNGKLTKLYPNQQLSDHDAMFYRIGDVKAKLDQEFGEINKHQKKLTYTP